MKDIFYDRTRRVTLVAFCALLATASTGAYGQAIPLKQSGSGWSDATAIDSNGDGEPKFSSWSASTGSLGGANTNGLTELLPWDTVTFCGPNHVQLDYFSASFVDRAANGDLLFRVMSNSPPSTLCFDFVNETFTFEVYTDVTGGTGRFEGHGGTGIITGSGTSVADGQSGFEFELNGTIE